jgi:hypothetical protein
MRNLKVGLLLAALTVTSHLQANTVTFTGKSGYGFYQMGQGGEFTVRPDAELSWVLDFYTAEAKGLNGLAGTFQTFCIEKSEHVWPNATYTAVINDHTMFSGHVLTKGAAWVYAQFATGSLTGYDYANRTTGGALQNTIWWLMGQEGTQPINAFSTAVLAALGSDTFKPNNDYYPVRVLNLWEIGHVGEQGYNRQDQLVMDPPRSVPDGGLSAGLLGFSLILLVAVKRSEKAR